MIPTELCPFCVANSRRQYHKKVSFQESVVVPLQ